ncbi:MAG TPA: DUF805 domain-containing protein [Allosphingosinicella sp.]|nr:DUF805 domain-containing protein [Allosphingosinicella sp.]
MSLFEDSLAALRRYRDFRGRSTRTDLIAFWLLTVVAGAALLAVASLLEHALLPGSRLADIVPACFQLLTLLPSAALAARRLHDRGWSGWWLLLLVPALVAGLIQQYYVLTRDFDALFSEGLTTLNLAAAAPALAILVLFCLPGEEETNRYGPNPRDEPPEETS